jgi:hypothetical protein
MAGDSIEADDSQQGEKIHQHRIFRRVAMIEIGDSKKTYCCSCWQLHQRLPRLDENRCLSPTSLA